MPLPRVRTAGRGGRAAAAGKSRGPRGKEPRAPGAGHGPSTPAGGPPPGAVLGNMRFPSAAQSGIKVKIENDIVVSTQLSAGLTLHFDLATNFVFGLSEAHVIVVQ